MSERSFSSRAAFAAGTAAAAAVATLLVVGPLQARSHAIPSGNLVQNSGFEDGPGSPNDNTVPPTGWVSTGKPSVWMYVAGVGFDRPSKDVATKIGGGVNFLSGGQGGGPAGPLTASASQAIDVSGAAVEIDANGVSAKLSAFLGGYTAQEDTARVDARFLGTDGALLGTVRVGPVTRDQRQRQTTLLQRSASANVPKGTRSIGVVITMSSPDSNTKLHGFADNISLELVKAVATPPGAGKSTLAIACSGKTLVVTVRPAAGSAVRSVTFVINGKSVAIDKKAPFTARIATRGLPAQLKVLARIQLTGKPTVTLTKAFRRC